MAFEQEAQRTSVIVAALLALFFSVNEFVCTKLAKVASCFGPEQCRLFDKDTTACAIMTFYPQTEVRNLVL